MNEEQMGPPAPRGKDTLDFGPSDNPDDTMKAKREGIAKSDHILGNFTGIKYSGK